MWFYLFFFFFLPNFNNTFFIYFKIKSLNIKEMQFFIFILFNVFILVKCFVSLSQQNRK